MMFSVRQDGQDWLILNSHGEALQLIPIAWFGKNVEEGENLNSSHVVCWPGCSDSISSAAFGYISFRPLRCRKDGRLIDEWMLSRLIESYGKKLGLADTCKADN
jgi:hypothetical protein